MGKVRFLQASAGVSAGSVTTLNTGAGEISLINPSDITDWGTSGAGVSISTTTTASDLPLSGPTDTAIKIVPVSGTAYAYTRWTMPASLKNTKLKVEWWQRPLSGYATGDFKVEVYKNSTSDYGGSYTEFNLSTDASGTSSIPNTSGKYVTTFDADDGDYYELRIVRTAGATALNICNAIVGPGIQPQGSVIGEWLTFTPTGAWTTNATYTGAYRRVGDTMEIQARISLAGAPGGGSNPTMNMPTGFTIDGSKIVDNNSGGSNLGSVAAQDGTSTYHGIATRGSSTSEIRLGYGGDNQAQWSTTVPFTFGSGDSIIAHLFVPIAEWAGTGVVNLVQNDVEYAYNTGTWGSANTSSFAYGPGGQLMGGTVAGSFNHRVRFRTPIQATDTLVLEFSFDRLSWFPAAGAHINGGNVINTINSTGSASSGAWIRGNVGNTTDVDVHFAQYMQMENDDGGVVNWPSSSGYWRVKKYASGAAVGFGNVTQSGSGLVKSAGQLLGTNTNDVAATGFVGEVLTATGGSVSLTTGQYNDATSVLTLTAGCWDVFGALRFTPAATTVISNIAYGLGTASGNSSTGLVQSQNTLTEFFPSSYVPRDEFSRMTPTYRVTVATTATYYLKALAAFSVSTCSTNSGFIRATRVR